MNCPIQHPSTRVDIFCIYIYGFDVCLTKKTSAQKKNYKKIKKPFLFPQNNLITSFFICRVKRQRQNDSAIQICEALQLINPYSKLFAVVFNLLERKYEPYTAFEAVHHHSKD